MIGRAPFGQLAVLTPAVPRRGAPVVVPMQREAFLLDEGEVLPVELLAMVWDPDEETGHYLGVFADGAAVVQSFPAGDVAFTEGAALKCGALRQRDAKRRAERLAAQQCDEAAAMLDGR